MLRRFLARRKMRWAVRMVASWSPRVKVRYREAQAMSLPELIAALTAPPK